MKASLHGHFLPDFGRYWLIRAGLEEQNLVQAATDTCLAQGMGLYTLTSDHAINEGPFNRHSWMLEQAVDPWNMVHLPASYEVEVLGKNAFAVERQGEGGGRVIFLNGRSLRIKDGNGEYEFAVAGANDRIGFSGANAWSDMFRYIDGEGLIGIAEHPLTVGKGGMGRERLEQFSAEGKITAIEHNAQLALPNWMKVLPKFKDFTLSRNEQAKEIAAKYEVPWIANDDSNWPCHVGAASMWFDTDRLDYTNDKTVTQSLRTVVRSRRFGTSQGWISPREWFRWALWEIQVRELWCGKKKKFDAEHPEVYYGPE